MTGSGSAWTDRFAVPALFLLLSVSLFLPGADWTHALIATSGGDVWSSVWFLRWWPWALRHGLDPLRGGLVYAPAGYPLSWATSIPTAALLALPVTLLFGANVSFNLLTALAPGLDGICAFLLMRACGGGRAASVLGGLLFGFSPYEIGQVQGHLNLDLTFCVPLVCLLVVRLVRGRLGARPFVVGLVLLLLAQFGLSAEIFASGCVFGAGAWLLFLLLSPPSLRLPLLRTGRLAALAAAIAAVPLLPWLLAMRRDAPRIPDFVNPAWLYSTNLLNLVVPNRLTWPGGAALASVSALFGGKLSEQGSYLGLPLLLALLLFALDRRRGRLGSALLLLTGGLMLCSLGPSLHAGGWDSRLPMPWWAARHLPLLRGALPVRFSLYAGLAAAVAACCWQGRAATVRGARQRLGLLGLAVLAILPDPAAIGWSRMPLLPFFAPDRIAAMTGRDPTLLVLPYLADDAGRPTPAMLWQWQSGMRFRQAGGFLSFVPYPDARSRLVQHLMRGEPGRFFANDIAAYVAGTGATGIAAGPGTGPALLSALHGLGWCERQSGGVILFEPPAIDALRYATLAGEYWSDLGDRNWMGREITVVTHGRGAVLHLDARGLPMPDTEIAVRSAGGDVRYLVRSQATLDIPLPPEGTFRIASAHVFRPGVVWRTADPRVLSFLVELRPDP